MIRWTDAEFTLTIPEVDLTACSAIRVTLRQNDYVVDIADAEVLDAHSLQCQLTQRQTAGFAVLAPARIQVNWLDGNGKRRATEIAEMPTLGNLLEEALADA